MRRIFAIVVTVATCAFSVGRGAEPPPPNAGQHFGKHGLTAKYRIANDTGADSVVTEFTLVSGAPGTNETDPLDWLHLQATKANGQRFAVWLLGDGYAASTLASARVKSARYLLQEGDNQPLEFRDQSSGRAVLPALGGWWHLFPRATTAPSNETFPRETTFLGHSYRLQSVQESADPVRPPPATVIKLRPDALIGFPHNTKQKDETRRYDGSDYELIRLTKADYHDMIEAGINCVRVDAEQAEWVEQTGVYYWGIGGPDVRYPECLYRSNYLGPALFLDEPAVVTRDYVVRPKLREDARRRKTLTPQMVLHDFYRHFRAAKYQGAPASLLKGLAARPDVDLGEMDFLQQNIYTWETMVSSAIHQLSEGTGGPPAAIVFEPPGRFGTRRTLPEMNMTYGCQIPVDDPKNLSEIIYGFLRGAARLTDKSWGMSIYGAVDRADTFWYQTHAYDLGATHFFYWDTAELACVPYGECLAMSRNLSAHAASHPNRDLERLIRAAEVAIVLPPGYNLGHVAMGKGSLWGLGELNLERQNRKGVKYRVVMSHFFTEIERCIRLGIAYDLFWNVDGLDLSGYREVVRIREDGMLDVNEGGESRRYDGPRRPVRPHGIPPTLSVDVSTNVGSDRALVTAKARIVEGSAPVYYTYGADKQGRYRNVMVGWELYGPGDEDYRFLRAEGEKPRFRTDRSSTELEIKFQIEQPGDFRLRAATVDLSGRTSVVWKQITINL